MRRLSLRWQQIVPRLLLVMVAVLSAHYVLGVLARWIAVRYGQEAFATQVEIGHARCSLLDRQLVLGGLRVANPRRPAHNLLEADSFELNFALRPLWQKQAIVELGRVTGLRLDPLAADAATGCATPESQTNDNWFTADADAQAHEWLARLRRQFEQLATQKGESLQRCEAFCARWPAECAALNARAAELKRRAVELEESTDAAEANRLRHAGFFRALPRKTSRLQEELDNFGAEIDEVSALLEAERREIVAARRRDDDQFRKSVQFEPFDVDTLTAYLLRNQLSEPLDELIGWLRWARRIVPAKATGPSPQQRGEEILFAGCQPTPDFLIRALQLHGTARLGTQSIELRGRLSDVTNSPARHGAPIRLRLKGAGSLPLELQATLSRTDTDARDELLVDCHGVELPEVSLGRPGALELLLGPSTGAISISVAVEGERLSGDIQLLQRQVRITPVLQGDLADVPLGAPLEATLGKVDSVATRVSLRGTLDEPSCALWSNLGLAVAEAMKRAVRSAAEHQADALLADTRRIVDERLAQLERQFAEQRSKLAAELANVDIQLETVAQRQISPERITPDQLGRRLPEKSLFR